MKVLYFGNPYVEEDSLAVKVAEKLKKELPNIDFQHIGDTFQLMDMEMENSLLLDVANSIKKVEFVNSDNVVSSGASTTHDFDLGFYLKLTGKNAKIIIIPKKYDEDMAVREVKTLISQFHPN